MKIISIFQIILFAIQIIIWVMMVDKNNQGLLTDEKKKDYIRANWACCAGVIILGIIGFILF